MSELVQALKATTGRATRNCRPSPSTKRPSTGGMTTAADAMAKQVMDLWTKETWKHKSISTQPAVPPGDAELELLDLLFGYPGGQPGRARQGQVPLQRHVPLQWGGYQRTDRQRQFRGQGDGRQGGGRQRRLGRLFQRAAQRRQPYDHVQPVHFAQTRSTGTSSRRSCADISRTAAARCR